MILNRLNKVSQKVDKTLLHNNDISITFIKSTK